MQIKFVGPNSGAPDIFLELRVSFGRNTEKEHMSKSRHRVRITPSNIFLMRGTVIRIDKYLPPLFPYRLSKINNSTTYS